jgi:hypothetical protein
MKKLIRSTVASLVLAATCMAYGAIPSLNVTVSDASGKAAYKGMTNAKGTFATAKLKPGNYTVQFTSSSGAIKGNYAIVVSAGTKKVSAAGVAGEKFAKGGVAMKVGVGADLNIAGQVAEETGPTTKDGKKMVWIPKQLGSNIAGHWADVDSAEAKEAKANGYLSNQDVQRMLEHYSRPANQ